MLVCTVTMVTVDVCIATRSQVTGSFVASRLPTVFASPLQYQLDVAVAWSRIFLSCSYTCTGRLSPAQARNVSSMVANVFLHDGQF